jgi:shikimate kinase
VHVVLVGMMGSGKSTVGRRVAERLGRPFVDADHDLEERLDRSIAEVFAAGGGVVLRPENRERLRREDVLVVWLRAEPAFLASRAEAKPHRPLLASDRPAREVFEELDAQRRTLYEEVADLTIDVRPFHAEEAKPKAAMADAIAAGVRDLERAREGTAP